MILFFLIISFIKEFTLSLKNEIEDLDGDLVENHEDPDIDGDGKTNGIDPDADGDGTPDAEDDTPGGPQ